MLETFFQYLRHVRHYSEATLAAYARDLDLYRAYLSENGLEGSTLTPAEARGFVGWLTRHSRKIETLVEGQAEILVHNGHVCDDALRRAGLTQHDLLAALREHDCADVTEVHAAILETDGRISVLTRKERKQG